MRTWMLLMVAVLVAGCARAPLVVSYDVLSHPEALLFSQRFPNIIVEVDHVRQFPPSEAALLLLADDLKKYAGKKQIRFIGPDPFDFDGQYVSRKTLDDIHNRTATVAKPFRYGEGDTAFLHVVYLSADYETPYMGLYQSSTGITLWPKYFDVTFTPSRDVRDSGHGYHREAVEKVALRHELGHAFGLVNCGIDMVHAREDAANPCHSQNPKSIMGGYTKPEFFEDPMQYVRWFPNGEPVTFDEWDLEDIAAWKTKDPRPNSS